MFKKPNDLRRSPKFRDLGTAMNNFLICAEKFKDDRPAKKQKTEHYETGQIPTLTGYIARK